MDNFKIVYEKIVERDSFEVKAKDIEDAATKAHKWLYDKGITGAVFTIEREDKEI